jgi:hypothetical protein
VSATEESVEQVLDELSLLALRHNRRHDGRHRIKATLGGNPVGASSCVKRFNTVERLSCLGLS